MVKFKLTLIAAIILFSYNSAIAQRKKEEELATAAVAPKKRKKGPKLMESN
jgi:hypothetical protein